MRLAILVILAPLVALQRMVEIVYAERNTRALLARGAVEVGREHYIFIVLLHAAWLAAIVFLLPDDATIRWPWLGLFILLQLARVWVISTLGPYWTTRIITLDAAPLVRKGPYRFVRHPNYLVVAGEIAALPLAFGETWVAVVFTLLNAVILAWRIREEDRALADRRPARRPMRGKAMSVLRYVGPFLFALSIPLFYALNPAAPFLTVALLLLALVGAEAVSPRGAVPFAAPQTHAFRWLPNLYVPVQLGVIAWAVAVAHHTSGAGLPRWLSVGVTTGVFGMLAAHELVHGHSRSEHALGLAMLTGMTYRHFRVAHIFGHHRWAATDRDPATARLGEGFYAFLVRTVSGQFVDAWRIESIRIAARRQSAFRHRIAGDVIAMAVVYMAIFAFAGWRGAALFAAQSAVGVIVLELFNYIAHYGLARAAQPKGHEPFGNRHSWNSSNVLANTMIFNMGRHSYHHTRPAASYQSLKWVAQAPELPAGYAGSILLALVPPLWRRVMDPAVQRLHTADLGAI